MRDYFCRTAAPDLLWSDGGPQFTSHQFADFLQTWGVTHVTSSPHYPQSNGKAEATVKSMKKLISAAWTGRSVNWDKLSCALLQYRNTPCRKDGLSPAQKLFGHPVQDTLPAHRRSFAPEWQRSSQEADSATTHTSKTSQAAYDQHAHPPPPVRPPGRQPCCSAEPHLQTVGHLRNYHSSRTVQAILHQNTEWSHPCQEPAIYSKKKPTVNCRPFS